MKWMAAISLFLTLCWAGLSAAGVHAQEGTPTPRQDEANQLLDTCYDHYVNGEFTEAIDACTRALPLYRALGDDALTAVTLTNLGLSHLSMNQLERALVHFEESLPLYQALGNRYGEAWAFNNMGVVYFRRFDYPSALDSYERALTIWREDVDPFGLGTTLSNLGSLLYAQADYAQAIIYYEEAAEIWASMENLAAAADTFNNLGLAYHAELQYDKSLTAYARAYAYWQTLNDLRGQAWTLNNRGLVYAAMLDYPQAIEHYQQALALEEAIDDRVEQARTRNNLGLVYSAVADYPQALIHFRLALALYQALGERWGEANVLTNIAFALKSSTEYDESLIVYQQAMDLWIALGNRAGEATVQQGLGDVHQARAAYQQALIHYGAAREIWRSLNMPMQEGFALLSMGITYQSLGDTGQALRHYRQGLALVGDLSSLIGMATLPLTAAGVDNTPAGDDLPLAAQTQSLLDEKVGTAQSILGIINEMMELAERGHETDLGISPQEFQQTIANVQQLFSHLGESSNRSEEAMRFTIRGYAHGLLGDYLAAAADFQAAYDLWSSVGDQANSARVRQYLGQVLAIQGDAEGALVAYNEALDLQRKIGDRAGEATTLLVIAILYEMQGDRASALEYALAAVDRLESIYGELKVESLQTAFAGGTAPVYHFVVRQLLAQENGADAFLYAERSRARTLLTLLGNGRINPKGSERSELIERETLLRSEIVELERQLRDLWGSPATDDRGRALAQIRDTLEIRRAEYEELLTDLQLTNPEYAGLVSVPPFGLAEAQAMLRQGAPDLTLLVYLVGVEDTVIFVVSAETFHVESVAVSQWDLRREVESLRAQMKTGLLLPDAWQKPAQTLYGWLIAPVETYLPAADADDPPTLAVIPHEVLHYLPFGLLHAPNADPSTALLLDGYKLSYAPSVSSLQYVLAGRATEDANLISFASPRAPGAPYLAYAEREADAVAALYSAHPLIGDAATEGEFKERAGDYELIHIAAHSDYNAQNPLFSAILLTPDDTEDGRLETHEIFNLDLVQTDLVVLSACETHLGQLSSGDELVGLERAFLRAGASSLLSTLWPVDDVATAYFMESFYTHLRADLPKAEALRRAQQETRHAYPEPYFWAGMVLVGAPR
ncbi:MAG: CHAT domain-containing protein [Caldilineaceae bacterium]|nr:CHAT domain-containing protein [Caldilineaceae bacterium]